MTRLQDAVNKGARCPGCDRRQRMARGPRGLVHLSSHADCCPAREERPVDIMSDIMEIKEPIVIE